METVTPRSSYTLADHLFLISFEFPPQKKYALNRARDILAEIQAAIDKTKADTGNPHRADLHPVLLNLYSIIASAIANATAPGVSQDQATRIIRESFLRAQEKQQAVTDLAWKVVSHEEGITKTDNDKVMIGDMTIGQVLERLGITSVTLNRYCRKAGVNTPGRGKKNHKFSPDEIRKFCQALTKATDGAVRKAAGELLAEYRN